MRFLLVHGGWQGGWCWDQVTARLRAAGHEAMLSQPGPLADAPLTVAR
jgi:hypothetical protein